MPTALQLERRRFAVGASEAGAVLGVSRYPKNSGWRVWAQKHGHLPELEQTWDMVRGQTMEPALLKWYADTTGAVLEYSPDTIWHPQTRHVLTHLDARAEKGGTVFPVEAKDVKGSMDHWWGTPGTDEIDPEYYPQAMVQAECTGAPWVDFVVSIGGKEPFIYRVPRQPRLGARIINRLAAWWERHIVQGQQPPIDGSPEARNWLGSFYPERRGLMLLATAEIEALAERRYQLVQQIRKLKASKETLEDDIRTIIGSAEGLEGTFGKVTWRTSEKTGNRRLWWSYKDRPDEEEEV